jgi:hypothetical protein
MDADPRILYAVMAVVAASVVAWVAFVLIRAPNREPASQAIDVRASPKNV